MTVLEAGDYRLVLDPERGGSIAAFTWRDQALYRTTCGPSMFDVACFPLVPFSNRIAYGTFAHPEGVVSLSPNFPDSDHPHPLHGFGWLTTWKLVEVQADRAMLHHHHEPGEWPWRYDAEQRLCLTSDGLVHELAVHNLSDTPMPAGLGFHPYFPRGSDTIYHGLHRGEWTTTEDGLPQSLQRRAEAIDWWGGKPVESREVDTAYVDRVGPLDIIWPDRALGLRLSPGETLPYTLVYSPAGQDYFCVEPVSHETNALNHPDGAAPMRWIAPGERFACEMRVCAFEHAGARTESST